MLMMAVFPMAPVVSIILKGETKLIFASVKCKLEYDNINIKKKTIYLGTPISSCKCHCHLPNTVCANKARPVKVEVCILQSVCKDTTQPVLDSNGIIKTFVTNNKLIIFWINRLMIL